jgi:hypothetical protein
MLAPFPMRHGLVVTLEWRLSDLLPKVLLGSAHEGKASNCAATLL